VKTISMQPDENDITYISYSLDTNILKSLYDTFFGHNMSFDSIVSLLLQIWTIYSIVAFLVSALFIAGIVYAYLMIAKLSEIEDGKLHDDEHAWQERYGGHHIENNRWQSVQTHLDSTNPNDWKLAIIEADVLLGHMLEKAGYVGNTIGEKLKGATARTFSTIDDAWQAHRVRNQIAHGGADFVLTQKIAKETLIMYERVFKEFGTLDDHGGGHGGGHGHH